MLTVNVICVGKLKEDYLRSACAEYAKRLGAFCKLNIVQLTPAYLPENPGKAQIALALKEEAKKISACVSKGDAVFAMCIEGAQMSSEEFAGLIDSCALEGESTVDFIIGSSYGLDDEIKKSSKKLISMGKMTFPHQLARVMLLEQIYRAFSILGSGKYHK